MKLTTYDDVVAEVMTEFGEDYWPGLGWVADPAEGIALNAQSADSKGYLTTYTRNGKECIAQVIDIDW